MKVTAWNNGSHHRTGAGYGLKIEASDRDRYFRKVWESVYVQLPNGLQIEINTSKASFWNDTCRELINKEIGRWLIESGNAPWSFGRPPIFKLLPQQERHFILNEN